MTEDERKAMAFVGLLLALSVAARVLDGRAVVATTAEVVAVDSLLEVDSTLQAREEESDRPLGATERIDVNSASATQLQRLSGVGPSTAAAIIAHRDSIGGFRKPEDLLDVRGIGPVTLERLRPHIETSARPSGSARTRRFRRPTHPKRPKQPSRRARTTNHAPKAPETDVPPTTNHEPRAQSAGTGPCADHQRQALTKWRPHHYFPTRLHPKKT